MDSTQPMLIQCETGNEKHRKSEEISRCRRYLPQVKKTFHQIGFETNSKLNK